MCEELPNHVTPLGVTDFRGQHQRFGIKDKDRLGHIYALGKTGVGKSTLLLNMAVEDIEKGNGLCVIDPHGDLATTLLHYIPSNREKDVIYFHPADTTHVLPFNPLAGIPIHQHHLAVAGLIATFKRMWLESWGPRLEHILRYSLFLLLASGNATLLDVQPLLTDKVFRQSLLRTTSNPAILSFWYGEFEQYSAHFRSEAIASILNKFGVMQVSPPLYHTFHSHKATWTVSDLMNSRKILIANLSKGTLGEDACSLLGSLLIGTMQLAALARSNQPSNERVPFYLYVDEAHSFLSLSMVNILSEARKFGLSLFLTHQYLEQLPEQLRSAILGNVGTLIAFSMGTADASEFAKVFYPTFTATDIVQLPRHSMYVKLLIDGLSTKAFSARAFSFSKKPLSGPHFVVDLSRKNFGVFEDEATGLAVLKSSLPSVNKGFNQPSLF